MKVMLSCGLIFGCAVASAHGQARPEFHLVSVNGPDTSVVLDLARGFGAVPIAIAEMAGWSVSDDGRVLHSIVDGRTVRLDPGSPFFTWDGRVLQFTDSPFRRGGGVWIPVQFFTEFLPESLPEWYQYSPREAILTVSEKVAPGAQREVPAGGSDGPSAGSERPDGAAAPRTSAARTPAPAAPPVRVVVVDAGHGGADPGTISRSGVREKQVALGVALSLAAALRENPLYEVRMIRDDDTFVELWDRGELATEWAGDRHGILVSIHANSFPPRQAARGFETYVNAEARTEHERRVAAIENAPLTVSGYGMDPNEDPDLGSILRDLRTLDDQHWSVLLAEFIQEEVARVHPGPDRGVKQTPLAVLTNALMPSVLVEIGYLSNADEAVVLGRPAFQKDAGIAIARAVDRFFQRYPPGATDEVGPAR